MSGKRTKIRIRVKSTTEAQRTRRTEDGGRKERMPCLTRRRGDAEAGREKSGGRGTEGGGRRAEGGIRKDTKPGFTRRRGDAEAGSEKQEAGSEKSGGRKERMPCFTRSFTTETLRNPHYFRVRVEHFGPCYMLQVRVRSFVRTHREIPRANRGLP